jgi:hypothetical protein
MDEISIYAQRLQKIIIQTKATVIPARHTSGFTPADAGGIQDLPKDDSSFFTYINKSNIIEVFSEEKKNKIDELFWMIEEYKVSLFAQELKTPYPVSKKKLDSLIREINETL